MLDFLIKRMVSGSNCIIKKRRHKYLFMRFHKLQRDILRRRLTVLYVNFLALSMGRTDTRASIFIGAYKEMAGVYLTE